MAVTSPNTQIPVQKQQPPVPQVPGAQQTGGPQVNAVSDPYVASASAPQSTSYASLTPIDPANDYRSQAITPGADPRLQAQQGRTDAAAANVAGFQGYTPYQAPNTNDAYTQQAQGFTGQAAQALGTGQVAGTNTSRAQSILDQAISQAGAMGSGGGGGGLNYGADTTALRAALAGQAGGLLSGAPSREELAAKQFALLQEQGQPGFEQQLREVNRSSAAMGRQGAGMTTNDLGTVAQRRNEALSQAARGLSADSAGMQVQDRLSALQAATGGFGALAGADQAQADAGFRGASLGSQNAMNSISALRGLSQDQFGLSDVARQEGVQDRNYGLNRSDAFSGLSNQVFGQGQGLRNENRTDQGNQFSRETSNFDAARQQLGDAAGLEQQVFGQGLTGRNELRGERDFQSGQAQQGIDNAIEQRKLEDYLQGTGFDRNLSEQGQLFDQGYAGDQLAANQLNNSADRNQQSADQAFGGVGSLLEEYLRSQQPTKPAIQPGLTDALAPYTPKVINTTRRV